MVQKVMLFEFVCMAISPLGEPNAWISLSAVEAAINRELPEEYELIRSKVVIFTTFLVTHLLI
jgi:hypothetical protein